jgi:hypothetical protein
MSIRINKKTEESKKHNPLKKSKTSGFGILKGKIKGSFTKKDKLQWRDFEQ